MKTQFCQNTKYTFFFYKQLRIFNRNEVAYFLVKIWYSSCLEGAYFLVNIWYSSCLEVAYFLVNIWYSSCLEVAYFLVKIWYSSCFKQNFKQKWSYNLCTWFKKCIECLKVLKILKMHHVLPQVE